MKPHRLHRFAALAGIALSGLALAGPAAPATSAASPATASGINPLQVAGCVTPPPNMVRWWTFDNRANLFAERTSNIPSTIITPATATTGKVAGGAAFATTRADSPAPTIGTRDFSMDVWIKTTQATGYFADTRTTATSKGWVLGINAGRPLLQLNSGGTTTNGLAFNYIAPTTVNDGQWHLLAVTIDRDGNVTMSVDGITKLTTPAKYPTTDLSGTTLRLGTPNGVTYTGALDEFEIFTRTLTTTEITNLARAGANGKCKLT